LNLQHCLYRRFGQVDDVKQKPATEEDEKMLKRAERFGLPLKRVAAESSSSSSSEDIREKRAKRFGLADNGGNEVIHYCVII
jgi:hypothetical protein